MSNCWVETKMTTTKAKHRCECEEWIKINNNKKKKNRQKWKRNSTPLCSSVDGSIVRTPEFMSRDGNPVTPDLSVSSEYTLHSQCMWRADANWRMEMVSKSFLARSHLALAERVKKKKNSILFLLSPRNYLKHNVDFTGDKFDCTEVILLNSARIECHVIFIICRCVWTKKKKIAKVSMATATEWKNRVNFPIVSRLLVQLVGFHHSPIRNVPHSEWYVMDVYLPYIGCKWQVLTLSQFSNKMKPINGTHFAYKLFYLAKHLQDSMASRRTLKDYNAVDAPSTCKID